MRRALSIGRVVLVYLLLGLVTTWAVAWGLALLPPGHESPTITPSHFFRGIHADSKLGIGSHRVHYSRLPRELVRHYAELQSVRASGREGFQDWSQLHQYAQLGSSEDWGKRWKVGWEQPGGGAGIDDARGFPLLAVWCNWPRHTPPSRSRRQMAVVSGSLVTDVSAATLVDLGTAATVEASPRSIIGGLELSDWVGTATAPVPRALPYMPIWSGLALNTAFYALLFFAVVRTARAFKHARRFRRGLCPKCKYDLLGTFTGPCPECGHTACKRKNDLRAPA